MLQVEFFFDFSCPWSYLACARVQEAAMRTGASIVWRPFVLADLDPGQAERAGRLDPNTVRAAWQLQDLEAWAHYCDLPLKFPEDWPSPARPALAGAVYAIEAGQPAAYVTGAFAAAFRDGLDLNDAKVLRDVATGAGFPEDEFVQAVDSPACEAVLQANLAELRSRGGFRSATLFVGEQMFCGNSRMPLVEFALAQASGRQFVMPGQHG